jgi:DMSO/TMAO reductase YedYZ molybdopterin-dependent catalytic subunit
VFLGAATSVLAISVIALGNAAWGLPLVPFDIFEWMTRILPGALVTAGIDAMVSLIDRIGVRPTSVAAKIAEQGMAILGFVVGSAILGGAVAGIGRGARARTLLLGLGAGAVWLVVEVIALVTRGIDSGWGVAWVTIVLLGWGALLGTLLHVRTTVVATHEPRSARRRFVLGVLGGVTACSALLLGLSSIARRGARGLARSMRAPRPSELTGTSGPAASPPSSVLAARVEPVHGTRSEITPNDSFYRIDINLRPPKIDAANWRLVVDGLVERRLSLSLDDLHRLPSVSQMITLECISNRVGGDLIGTSLWTGVRLRDVLDRAGMTADARALHIAAADGFYESIGLADMHDDRTLLVYAMNHEPLPESHGFPLRIYIPDRHGMKQPKWITRMSVSDREGPGYWVDRGWSKTAIPNTTSVIDTVGMSMMLGQARVLPVGGIAYAGARGISKVEVQVDRGPWKAAQLIAPPLSPLCWVLWRYEWPYVRGRHTFRVRAYDGTGALQPIRETSPHPAGATGIHSLTTTV